MTPLFRSFFAAVALAGSVLSSCATPPVVVPAPPGRPASPPAIPLSLDLRDVRAAPSGPGSVSVSFTLAAANPGAGLAELESLGWSLFFVEEQVSSAVIPQVALLEGGASTELPVAVEVAVPASAGTEIDFTIRAAAARVAAGGPPIASSVEIRGRVPVIREPIFSVMSIKIKKAELINTKFEVVLRVENPNAVPLSLISLAYELFGDRRLWIDGSTGETIRVPANGSVDRKLSLAMNFINMKRDLLDQVIRLRVVDYHFKGNARIATEFPDFPEFSMPYDLTGQASVVE